MNEARVILKEVKDEEPVKPIPKIELKKPILFGVMALAIAIACSLGYFWFVYAATHISTDNAYIDTDIFQVNCRIMGFVKEVFVQENDEVKKGQVIAALDDTDFKVELGFKKAKLVKAQADFSRAQKLFKLSAISPSDFELAQANLAANEADYNGTMLKISYTQVTAPVDGVVAKKAVQVGQFIQPGQGLFNII